MSFLADDDDNVVLKYNKIWRKKIHLVFNLIFSLFRMKNVLRPKRNLLNTKLLQNLQTINFKKRIYIIHVLLQILLIL